MIERASLLKGTALVAVFTLSVVFTPVLVATADSGPATFQWVAGAGPVCTMAGPDSCPDVAAASNGHTITIAGSGTLSIHPKSASGSGTFVEKDSNGVVVASGTWTATQLLSFDSYGTAPPFPSFAYGGQALIHVHLSTGTDGILKVTCLIGSPPAGKEEGVELNIQSGPNFNHQVSGDTVFILS
jgi:hypothetical protein